MKTKWIRWLVLPLLLLLLCTGVSGAECTALVPVGQTVQLELCTEGVYVVGFDETRSPAREAGLKTGDLIVSVDAAPLQNAAQLGERVNDAGGAPLVFRLRRQGKDMGFTVTPVRTPEGWRLGVFVQDHVAGIGTITYFDPASGRFGALGHGVYLGGGSALSLIRGGTLTAAEIVGVVRGEAGTPGALRGRKLGETGAGRIEHNTDCGVFGVCPAGSWEGPALPVAARSQIRTGSAQIWSCVDGRSIGVYDVKITSVRRGAGDGKDLELRITDRRLLEKTGGIVQGMSGSPIIQDGRLVGAVTHVLVQDPACGYGIFIDRMLEADRTAA